MRPAATLRPSYRCGRRIFLGPLENFNPPPPRPSTRLIGALIMTHSDDNGLVLPPKLAPFQVVIVPIYKGEEQLKLVSKQANKIKAALESKRISVKYDERDTHKPGWKFAEYELKGVPIRLAIGQRDLENGTIEVARRDTLEKETLQIAEIETKIRTKTRTITKTKTKT